MEKRKFEDSWKDAFEKAEVNPSENVWTNIELDLEKAKGSNLKRKLVFFQLLAAASVVFAMGISVGVYIGEKYSAAQPMLSENQTSAPGEKKMPIPPRQDATQSNIGSESDLSISTDTNDNTSTVAINKNTSPVSASSVVPKSAEASANENGKREERGLMIAGAVGDESKSLNQIGYYSPSLSAVALKEQGLATNRTPQLPVIQKKEEQEVIADPVQLMLAKLEAREREMQKEDNKDDEKQKGETLWTSIGFAAGSFNPVNSGVTSSKGSVMAMSQNSSIANQEVKASGITYSIGANVGTKLTDRWVIQGGVNYLTQSADYTANNVVGSADYSSFRPATIHELNQIASGDNPEESRLLATSPYNVNNSLRYLSIPLQAGYLIVNRDFGFQLNAGIATDVFLQNTVTAEGDGVQPTNQDLGEDTPYRSVNLSGLMGTEFSYRFAQRYRISLNPGLRYPFSSIYRSELNVKATPLTFDVGVRFRYIFK